MFQISIPVNSASDEMAPQYVDERLQKDYELLQSTASIRDGQRLPTPDRRAVIELSDSQEEKHHLRRQQQLLTDIALRAREQEITELSGALSKKCTLDEFDRKYERPNFGGGQPLKKYATNTSSTVPSKGSGSTKGLGVTPRTTLVGIGEEDSTLSNDPETSSTSKAPEKLQSIQNQPEFARNTTYFPKRTPRRTPRGSSWKSLPRLQISYTKGLPSSHSRTQHKHMIKTNLIRTRNINGPIQLKHYIQAKDPLAPLILPSIKSSVGADLDRVDTFMQSSQVDMKHRPQTIYDGFLVGKPPIVHSKTVVRNTNSNQDTDGAWVTQSMATLSIAPSTSPTPLSQQGRAKTVLSRVSYG